MKHLTKEFLFRFVALFAVYLCCASASGAPYGEGGPQALVLKQAGAVSRSHDAGTQIAAAEKLRNTIFGTDERTIDDPTIHTVADLLELNNDGVRYWVADALSRFGKRAQFAGPRLLEILKQRDCVMAETTSIYMIRRTLNTIGMAAPPRNCGQHSFSK